MSNLSRQLKLTNDRPHNTLGKCIMIDLINIIIEEEEYYFPLPMKSSKVRVLLFQTMTLSSLNPSIRVNTNFS